MEERNRRKVRQGVVFSDKMDKTITVVVEIMETRPLSATKRWRLVRIVEKKK